LYEGVVKLMDPAWTAQDYLLNSRGFLSGMFHWMASNSAIMEIVDFLNVWGLIFIGLGLFLGVFARLAVYSGILLLLFYYLAYPPFMGYNFGVPQEGHYLFVDKTFIELISLVVLALFPASLDIGLWSLAGKTKLWNRFMFRTRDNATQTSLISNKGAGNRREILKHLAFLPFMGGFAWACASQRKQVSLDGITGSTITLNSQQISDLEGEIPMGNLGGKKPVSRLILGGNLIQHNSHARDLIYVNSLFKAYNNERKIFETLILAEEAGINTLNINIRTYPLIARYKKMFGSHLQTMVCVAPSREDIFGPVDQAIDQGNEYILIQGATVDKRIYEGDIDVIAKCLDYIKKKGMPAGLGAHTIQAMYDCVNAGMEPDFYYKTFHHDKYWSAHPMENRHPYLWSANQSDDHNELHNNMWCLFPDKTAEFFKNVRKPVVAFKVLAAGAIRPEDGFQYAFDNGADFISVGMFDFQVVANANQAIRSIEKAKNRSRPWYG